MGEVAAPSPAARAANPVATYTAQLRAEYLARLAEVLDGIRTVALIDVPNHSNPGDSAILLGELRALRELGVKVAYMVDQRGYHPRDLVRAHPEGPILIHGGGNFGDLYPRHLAVRLRALVDFPHRRVVHLPQSVYFRDADTALSVARAISAHRGSVVFARDALSATRLEGVGIAARLSPDAAFVLGPRLRVHDAEARAGFLRRTDREALPDDRPLPGVSIFDWPHPSRWSEAVRLGGRAGSFALQHAGRLASPVRPPVAKTITALARHRLRDGFGAVARFDVLVTDRLHGHILASLAGIPTVVLESASGKVSAFLTTWSPPPGVARAAADRETALVAVQQLLDTRAAASRTTA